MQNVVAVEAMSVIVDASSDTKTHSPYCAANLMGEDGCHDPW